MYIHLARYHRQMRRCISRDAVKLQWFSIMKRSEKDWKRFDLTENHRWKVEFGAEWLRHVYLRSLSWVLDKQNSMISYLSLFLLAIIARSVHCTDNSFYITNVAAIRQCTTEKPLYLQLFDSKQMSCLGRTWRHISANIEYACEQNQLKHFWTLQTKLNPSVTWPKKVHLLTVYEKTHVYTLHSISVVRDKETMEESARPFNPAQNSFVTYVWVSNNWTLLSSEIHHYQRYLHYEKRATSGNEKV